VATDMQELNITVICPWCASEKDFYFDRTVYKYSNGTQSGPYERCRDCGKVIEDYGKEKLH
jgi:uncharacterized Zn finger protein